jgi:hypothetical protein
MRKSLVAAAAFALLSTGTLADEVWTTPIGEVVYEAEIDGVAIFTYPLADGVVGRIYLPGLAGNYDNRSSHLGYWIAPGDGGCPAEMTGADGNKSKNWGQVLLVFHTPAFPAGWTLVNGVCFGPLVNSFVGTPKVAEEIPATGVEPLPPELPAPSTEPTEPKAPPTKPSPPPPPPAN